CQQHTTYPRTF
nr:immunoglobulin light chain junction region [Macaca mulatta]MOX48830.1 immunoglobulin light chain junction region [Macaca mulatta]MOX49043.1 immunoglobulin light chain junction region [Macaca mulatta]MOX51061.1 immunoglobulin light chain junction region [Macaca mulatta]